MSAGNHQQRVAVGHGLGDQLGGEIAARAGPIVDHHGLPKTLGELLAEKPPHRVIAAAGRKADNHADGFGGVGGGLRRTNG